MDKQIIKSHASAFIKAAHLESWSQEAHNAFVAYVAKRELKLAEPQIKALLELMNTMPALTANASAFRQWLESKDVALLKKQETAAALSNRYANLV